MMRYPTGQINVGKLPIHIIHNRAQIFQREILHDHLSLNFEAGDGPDSDSKDCMRYTFKIVASPVGKLTLVACDSALTAILWENERPGRVKLEPLHEDMHTPVLIETERQLAEYFKGRRHRFDIALRFVGTDFQRSVWAALLDIPYGETCTYSDIATRIGYPTAARAVGAANGRNPISIIAPCHRVIGASGELTGFAGGLLAKQTLLTLEGARQDNVGGSANSRR